MSWITSSKEVSSEVCTTGLEAAMTSWTCLRRNRSEGLSLFCID